MPHRVAMYTPPVDLLPMPLALAWGAGCGLFAFAADVTQVLPSGTPWWGAMIVAATPAIIAYLGNQKQNADRVKALQDSNLELTSEVRAMKEERRVDAALIQDNARLIADLRLDLAAADAKNVLADAAAVAKQAKP